MSYVGTVENGVVVLPADAQLPEGTRVNVEPLPAVSPRVSKSSAGGLASLAGIIEGPSDLAAEHDHYAHGSPKRAVE